MVLVNNSELYQRGWAVGSVVTEIILHHANLPYPPGNFLRSVVYDPGFILPIRPGKSGAPRIEPCIVAKYWIQEVVGCPTLLYAPLTAAWAME